MSTYNATVTRGDTHWLIHVEEIDQWTQARSLAEIPSMTADLISVMTDTPVDDIDLIVVRELPAEVLEHLRQASELREKSSRDASAICRGS